MRYQPSIWLEFRRCPPRAQFEHYGSAMVCPASGLLGTTSVKVMLRQKPRLSDYNSMLIDARAGIRTRVDGSRVHHDGPGYTTRAQPAVFPFDDKWDGKEIHFHFHSLVVVFFILGKNQWMMGDMMSNEPRTAAEIHSVPVWAWRVAPARTGRCLPVLEGVVQ